VVRRSFGTESPGITSPRHTDGRYRRRCQLTAAKITVPVAIRFLLAAALLSFAGRARADDIVAVYAAYWACLPAGEIRLRLHDGAAAYRDEIEIRTTGLPALLSKFRATALAEGRLAADRPAEPSHYNATYDLRKRRDSRISMHFVARGGAVVAERGPDDTSRKPPLAEKLRSNAVDPVTAFNRVRGALRAPRTAGGSFTIPVYDGARRFDILGYILPKKDASEGTIRAELTLRPIAGFKGETSEDGDPDSAPRKVDLLVTDDSRTMPLSLTVPVFFMPLVVRFMYYCASGETCPH
jgi:Protein of unknown function (DUF3108)